MGSSISAEECFGLRGQAPISDEAGPANERKRSQKTQKTYAERRRKEAKENGKTLEKKKELLKHALNDMKSRAAIMHGEDGVPSSIENIRAPARKPNVESEVNSVSQSAGERFEESEASTTDPSESQFLQVTTYLVGVDARIVGLSFRSLPPKMPLVVDRIHPGTWASTTDIKPGDELVSVEDGDVEEMQREEFMQLMQHRPLHFCMARNTELEEAENEFFPDSFDPRKSVELQVPVFDMAANDDPRQSARRHSCQ